MSKLALDSRDSIQLLVESFYEKVKRDELGPIFNNADNFEWQTHIPVMVDFWQTMLLDEHLYKGNTMRKHIDLHRRTPLAVAHFARWKELFYSTLDESFHGDNVEKAKKKVRDIAGLMQYKLAI